MNRITDRAATKSGVTRTAALAITAAVATLALSACSSSAGTSSASPSGNGAGTSASTGSSAGTGGSGSSGSGSSTSGSGGSGTTTGTTTSSSSGGGTASGTAGCATSQLSVVQQNPSVGAGQYYSTLVFTNTSNSSCTMSGYPGVSYVVANGVQSGNPATRVGGSTATVTLAPGGKASATLHDSDGISGYSPQQCQLTPAQGLRIYPPNQKAALFVPWKTSHCAGLSIHPLTIGPITQ
jgi:hypothetical protein